MDRSKCAIGRVKFNTTFAFTQAKPLINGSSTHTRLEQVSPSFLSTVRVMFAEENPLNLPSIETPTTASLADFVMRSIPSKDCDWGGLRDEAKERLHGRLHLGYTQTQFRLYVHTNPAICEIAYSFLLGHPSRIALKPLFRAVSGPVHKNRSARYMPFQKWF